MKTVFSILLTISLALVYLAADAQINTEKFRRYSAQEGFVFNTKFLFGYSAGNSQYISLDGTFRLDYNGKKNNAFIVANYEYKETEAAKVVNKGFIHLRGVRPMSQTLSMEGFLQQEFNEFLLLEDRKVVGSNFRVRLLDLLSKKDSITSFSSYLGTGIMYEHEVYNVQETESLTSTYNSLRVNTYLTFDLSLSNRINLWAVGYFQPNLVSLNDFRTVVETGLEILIIGRLFLTMDLSYRYNNQPVGDVSKYDLVFKNGLRFSVP